MLEWISRLLSPIITGIISWFNKWSTEKNQQKHDERMRRYDLMEKALEPPETLSKRMYIKWFYEQEVSKKNLKRTNKQLEEAKGVPECYKVALKEGNFFDTLDAMEQKHQVIQQLDPAKGGVVNAIN